jgi:hypothetical protein
MSGRWLLPVLVASLCAFVAVGFVGVGRYARNYWLYRGFPPPSDPAYVSQRGTVEQIKVTSAALGGRSQPVYVYLPPGYDDHPNERYPVLYLLHGFPGRPLAFLLTVRMGVVEDELVARHRAHPLILVMPFGSTGTFTDKEWANGIGPYEGWGTFVWRDVVHAIDARYRTIASPAARAIGGLSEGGYGAVNIALQHPHEFSLVESWSGYERAAQNHSIFGSRMRTCSCAGDTTGRSAAEWRRAPTSLLRRGWRMLRAARIVTASVVSFAVVVGASGWLYVIQPHSALPGPAIGDALPLDELSRRSAVPLLVFLAVWAAAALLLGLIARASRAERLTAGLMLGLGVGGWAYLQTGLSLLIVRQVPAHQAFHAAAGKTAIYLPAVLAGAAGALGGRLAGARGRGARSYSPGLSPLRGSSVCSTRSFLTSGSRSLHRSHRSTCTASPKLSSHHLGLRCSSSGGALPAGNAERGRSRCSCSCGSSPSICNTASATGRSPRRSLRSRCSPAARTSMLPATQPRIRGSPCTRSSSPR